MIKCTWTVISWTWVLVPLAALTGVFLCIVSQPVEWAKIFVSIATVIVTYRAFAVPFLKNSRIKTIETLMALEEQYKKHLPFLLELEVQETYDKIDQMLEREDAGTLMPEDIKILNKLDGVLRHFYICLQVRESRAMDNKILDNSYGYYLRILANVKRAKSDGSLSPDNKPRVRLGKFVTKYWKDIPKWADNVNKAAISEP